MKQDDLFWIWLSLRLGPNNPAFLDLFRCVGKPYDIYRADAELLEQVPGIKDSVRTALMDKRLSDAQNILSWCRENRAVLCRYGESTYPARLLELKRPPLILYVQGHIPDLTKKLCVGVVGTRNCSEYGAHTAYKISYELATAGAVIVSGMAKGIDGVAAAGALAAGGYTIAVLGCGLDVVYPKAHAGLMHEIIRRGAVITEYPPFSEPEGKHFPVRNRIISGLSDGALIVEAPAHSGAMITADIASDQGRVIYATPGNVDSERSEGPNRLIRDGAQVVLDGHDVLHPFLSRFQQYLSPERIRRVGKKSEYNPAVLAKLRMPDYAELARKQEYRKPVAEEDSAGLAEALTEKLSAAPDTATPVPVAFAEPKKPQQKRGKDSGEPEKHVSAATEERAGKPGGAGSVSRTGNGPDSPQVPKTPERVPDRSGEALASLSEKYRKIFTDLPMDQPFSPDQIVKLGYSTVDVLTAMTVLEVKGLVRSLPGGLYQRN